MDYVYCNLFYFQSSSPEPRDKHQNESRPISRKNSPTRMKTPKSPLQALDNRREQRISRRKPWMEKPPTKSNNKNTYIGNQTIL